MNKEHSLRYFVEREKHNINSFCTFVCPFMNLTVVKCKQNADVVNMLLIMIKKRKLKKN